MIVALIDRYLSLIKNMRIIIAPMKAWWLIAAFLVGIVAQAQEPDAPNALLLVAKPDLADPNFRETVVLVTQTPDYSTVGVVLNRPASAKDERSGRPLYAGGPVLPRTRVALFSSDSAPGAPAFHVLKRVYLSMHPSNIESLLAQPARNFRLFVGFSGWAPRQLEAEMRAGGWYVLPASEELLFREDTSGLWHELLERARGARAEIVRR